MRYLWSLIYVTKSSIAFLKRGKKGRELSLFFFIIIADAICLLTAIAYAPFFYCVIAIKLFWCVSFRHLIFGTSTHAMRLLGTLNTCFLSFCQVSVCHLSLSRISLSNIFRTPASTMRLGLAGSWNSVFAKTPILMQIF